MHFCKTYSHYWFIVSSKPPNACVWRGWRDSVGDWGVTIWASMLSVGGYHMGQYAQRGGLPYGPVCSAWGVTIWASMISVGDWGVTIWASMLSVGGYHMGQYAQRGGLGGYHMGQYDQRGGLPYGPV